MRCCNFLSRNIVSLPLLRLPVASSDSEEFLFLAAPQTLAEELKERCQELEDLYEEACQERDTAIRERDEAFRERDKVISERNIAIAERDEACLERDEATIAIARQLERETTELCQEIDDLSKERDKSVHVKREFEKKLEDTR